MKRPRFLLVTLIFVLASILTATVNAQQSVSIHLTLGNPSGATDDVSNKDNFLMVKPQFVLSYNNSKGGPNWASWHLKATDIGKLDRGDFHADTSLPAGFVRITKANYTNSGFDRGHVVNSKDRTANRINNNATFNMTNILPQAPQSNQGPWKRLEDFERKLASAGNELYIVAGAFGAGGSGEIQTRKGRKLIKRTPVSATKIAGGRVRVPKTFWKVIIVLPEGTSTITNDTRAIAVCMPNKQGTRNVDWRKYVTTIRTVEGATGYDFLSETPKSIQNAIEIRPDSEGTGIGNPCR